MRINDVKRPITISFQAMVKSIDGEKVTIEFVEPFPFSAKIEQFGHSFFCPLDAITIVPPTD